MQANPKFTFRPFTKADLPLMRFWLSLPHWRARWEDEATEISYIEDMLEGRDTTRPFLIECDGLPIGYIQYWFVADQIAAGWDVKANWLLDLPRTAIGVDLSIGLADNLHKGFGSAALRQFAMELLAEGHRDIFIDPDQDNSAAIRAYEKAGFVAYSPLMGKTHDCLIMKFDTRA